MPRELRQNQKSTSGTTPKVGDIVLIEFPSLQKTKWPMGRIVEVKSRSAVVKNGSTKRIVEYPWKSLYPLETAIAENDGTKQPDLVNIEKVKSFECYHYFDNGYDASFVLFNYYCCSQHYFENNVHYFFD
ncbi:Protein CBG25524 [Caenorhabditis briggsae]|uniref:Protein CBG25524 n=1 Tax=Caenorhabditis briggsae TaxID=6238 RepID=B6IFP9_CAEBR|nr:Protein CBG25524 [Caenorhabditis briggsae]CAR98729.1 Protein CBG25524 [Caenorhabditis briggsae]